MSFFGDIWDGIKNVANDLNPVTRIKKLFSDPIGSVTDMFTKDNPLLMPMKETLRFFQGDTNGKSWDDLNPFQKMSMTIQSKAEGILNTPAKWLGLDPSSPMEDLMTKLKHSRMDDTIGNMITGLSTGAGQRDQGEGGGFGSGGMGGSPSDGSLGRPLALEEDPVLNLPVENYNNFSF